MQPDKLVEGFLKPYLAQNYPHADLVILAGSFGRALKSAAQGGGGAYLPIASSDADMVVIYKDLEKDGFKAAFKKYEVTDVSTVMGGPAQELMVDCNVHDLASLLYQEKAVREHSPWAFLFVMLDEGQIIFDRTGIGPLLQERAKKFIEAGPVLVTQAQWQGEIDFLGTYLRDIRAAQSDEEKRFLGVLALVEVCEYTLGLNKYWRSGSNQAYRRLAAQFPEDEKQIRESFSALLRDGKSGAVEKLLEDLIRRGAALKPELPVAKDPLPYPVDQYVAAEDKASMDRIFYKFMAEHLCGALETSKKRGELAHLENLSGTIRFIKKFMEHEQGTAPAEGRAAIAFLSQASPTLLPATLQALDEGVFQPIDDIANDMLKSAGGLRYTTLFNYYAEDVARVNANDNKTLLPAPEPASAPPPPKKSFKAGYTL